MISFYFTCDFASELHRISAKEEVHEWGGFRSGQVTIAGSDYMPPPASELNSRFEALIQSASEIEDVTIRRFMFFY